MEEGQPGVHSQPSGDVLDTQWEMVLNATTSELHDVADITGASNHSNQQMGPTDTFHTDADLLNAFAGAEPLFDNIPYPYNGKHSLS